MPFPETEELPRIALKLRGVAENLPRLEVAIFRNLAVAVGCRFRRPPFWIPSFRVRDFFAPPPLKGPDNGRVDFRNGRY